MSDAGGLSVDDWGPGYLDMDAFADLDPDATVDPSEPGLLRELLGDVAVPADVSAGWGQMLDLALLPRDLLSASGEAFDQSGGHDPGDEDDDEDDMATAEDPTPMTGHEETPAGSDEVFGDDETDAAGAELF